MDQVNRTPVTFIVLIAYFTLGTVTGLEDPSRNKLMEFGAAAAYAVPSEPWRLIAYAFLHGGLLHLVLNSLFLFLIGPRLEETLGSLRFTLLYIVCAIGGAIGGNLWHSPFAPLVGGSGALFGMAGAAVALNMRHGRHLLDFLNYRGPRMLLSLIAINLLLGMMFDTISNAGHIGGLISGFVLSFCFLYRGREAPDRASRAVQIGWIALFTSLLLYCTHPVVRTDYLVAEYERAETGEDQTAYAVAALRSAGDQSTLVGYVMALAHFAGKTEDEGMLAAGRILRSAAGR